jgi:ubiquinol oxidase
VQLAYDYLMIILDRIFEGRAIERFWYLETVARIPYFSFVTVLHLYETLGFWRTAELRQVHNAEEWNELHHLLIMESLGGNRQWWVRFLAEHSAIATYWFIVLFYFVSPTWSYKFSEMLEMHAVNTYAEFIEENMEKLKDLPAPEIAIKYYKTGDLYMFDQHSSMVRGDEDPRRPPADSLLDVFKNIRDDEWEHVKTMVCCQDDGNLDYLAAGSEPATGAHSGPEKNQLGDVEFAKKNREAWERWASKVNAYTST